MIYQKTRGLKRKENKGIWSLDEEDSQGKFVTNQWQILKIWEDYTEQLYNKKTGSQDIEMET